MHFVSNNATRASASNALWCNFAVNKLLSNDEEGTGFRASWHRDVRVVISYVASVHTCHDKITRNDKDGKRLSGLCDYFSRAFPRDGNFRNTVLKGPIHTNPYTIKIDTYIQSA